jgi:hypothetical protein
MNNFTKLAKMICEKEGLKKQVNIAQVKEILKIIFDDLTQVKYLKISYLDAPELSALFVEILISRNLKRAIKKQAPATKKTTTSKKKQKKKVAK